jgi:hypothetical protein
MATGALVSVEKYLSTSFHPDREYIDGEIVERNLGELDHSSLPGAVAAYIFHREKEWQVRALPGPRVRVSETRSRRADVYTADRGWVVKDGILRTRNPDIVVPLAEVFASIE